MSQEYYSQVAAAFDRAAASYQDVYAGNPIMAWLTEDSFAHVCRVFPPGARLLEIGCGTGAMAVRVARAGREVVATDISPAMVEQGRKMAANQAGITWVVAAAGELVARVAGPFDGAYSNFGPLNCEPDLGAVGRVLAALVAPGGAFICSVMNRWCAWEIGWELARLHPRAAVRRLGRGWVPARMSAGPGDADSTFPVRYFSPSEFARAFHGLFLLEETFGYPVARFGATTGWGGTASAGLASVPRVGRPFPRHPAAHKRACCGRPVMNDLLACPLCHSGLILHAAGWVCPTDGACYTLHASGLVDFRPEASRAAGDEFARRYREARLAEGVRPLTREHVLRLPNGHPSGYTRVYWSVRRESLAALWTLLPVAGETLSIADLGAGIPWLSHRLAERHHRVIAVDLSPDADFGLGAARHFPTAVGLPPAGDEAATLLPAGRFFPVLGDLENPPLATGRFDCVMCNASLHYARDLTSALRHIAAAVRPGGAVIVMDSPLGEQPRPSASGGRVLGRHELMDALHQAGLVATWHDVARGWLWRRRQIKNRLLRRVGFDFPLIIAEPRHKSPSPEE